jgi:hypothetical protein
MAMPSWADVVAIAPGDAAAFTAMDPAAQAALLGYATAQCNPGAWGALLNNGIVYLAAHLAKLGLLRGAGQVTEESVGQLSRSYATMQGLKGSLGMTSYGAEYRRLLKLLPTALGAVY